MSYLTVEDIIRENDLYMKSVIFFKVFSKEISNHCAINIEKTISTPKSSNQRPDFIILSEDKAMITTVIEHKSSITKEKEYVLRDILDIYNKYSQLLYNEKIQNPQVVYVYPKTCRKVINEIKDKIELNICLWEFDLNLNDGKLTFSQVLNNIFDNRLKYLLGKNFFINFDLAGTYSRYKFIRKDPHPTYTSFSLWNVVFKTFEDITNFTKSTICVKYDNIIEQSKTFFPEWIEDRERKQITEGRINKALHFLQKLKLIEWDKTNNEIEIYHKKLSRVGDLSSYLCKKWVELEELGGKLEIGDKKQTILDDYF